MSLYFFDPMYSAVQILTESTDSTYREELNIRTVLEDVESPVTNKYLTKLYDSVVSKSHIDFDDIPHSRGNITQYKGYTNMIEVLTNIMRLASDEKATNVIEYTKTVQTAITHMRALAPIYEKGFKLKHDYIMLEYNTFVYTIVQGISTLLYEFVDYIKRPDRATIDIVLKNTKYKANTYYIDQLVKFNKINEKMNYSKYLESLINNGKDNFTGVEVLGVAAVIAVGLAIVPVTRELVYRYYNIRSNISECLAQQAYFLEMNKSVVEANSDFSQKKKDAILIKQEKLKNIFLRLSEKLRVNHIKSENSAKSDLQADNKLLTIDNIKKEVSNAPLTLL